MKLLTPLIFVFLFSLSMFQANAQPGGGRPCPKPPCPPVPISGIEFLIGGGVLFGLKKIMGREKSNKNQ